MLGEATGNLDPDPRGAGHRCGWGEACSARGLQSEGAERRARRGRRRLPSPPHTCSGPSRGCRRVLRPSPHQLSPWQEGPSWLRQRDVCMSHHPGPLPCGWRRGWGWGGNKPSTLENSEPAQPRPRLSCAVSPALSPETGCCPRSDVTAAEPTAPAAPPPWGGAFRARSQRKTRVRLGAGSGMGDVTAQGDPRSMRAGTAAPSPRPSTEPLRGLRETTPDRRSGHPSKLHRVRVKPPLTLRAEAFGEACPWDMEGVTRESGGLGSLCVSTRARP